MKLAAGLGIGGNADFQTQVARIVDMEKAGLDIASASEAWGFDAFSRAGLRRGQDRARAAGDQHHQRLLTHADRHRDQRREHGPVSGGRFILGLGSSGPQVIEGF